MDHSVGNQMRLDRINSRIKAEGARSDDGQKLDESTRNHD